MPKAKPLSVISTKAKTITLSISTILYISLPTHYTLTTKSQRPPLSIILLKQHEYHRQKLKSFPEVVAMEDDWDLHAVVRGCFATATSCTSSPPLTPPLITDLASNSTTPFFSPSYTDHFCTQFLSLPDHFEDLHELLINPLRHKPSPQPPQTQQLISLPSTTASIPFLTLDQQKQRPSNNTKHSHGGSLLTTPRSKKKKNQMKKVCQVAAESLSSDIWAWRKYGQKPIKGSPYPRGYYRCSSSKGCMARKQVERNRSDPNMFIVTYTAEHNHPAPTHRNSLAGSTRQKPSSPPAVVASEGNESQTKQSACSSSASMEEETMESKETEVEEDGEEEGGFVISDMVVSEDFFWGLQEPDGPGTIGDYFPDQYPADFGIPWVVNSSAATAASSS